MYSHRPFTFTQVANSLPWTVILTGPAEADVLMADGRDTRRFAFYRLRSACEANPYRRPAMLAAMPGRCRHGSTGGELLLTTLDLQVRERYTGRPATVLATIART